MSGVNAILQLDIEVYDEWGDHTFAQARYLAHGYDDVLWTNDAGEATRFLADQLRNLRARGIGR